MTWINAHGFACLVFAFMFSGATSVMPPLPMGRGWWETWIYNIVQLFGANLGNLAKHTPEGATLESMMGKQVKLEANGTKTTTEIATASIPAVTAPDVPK